ncbi:NCS1 family transporter [Alteribacillus iranensis]|uniref:Nucleobase:cation symporter-1, NCS1 family n=1 Tax=Alteribacillus iranensis TaxID=930128 RepID=A0A1I2BQB4_9BACI|nr:NCS1 family transporter [Alteribacillus iranensis]SFE58038.1 nucleobase:cation symporter-1, NCS1 family [Alteribacillus iranensis]
MENKDQRLRSPDLFPIGSAERNIGTFGFAIMWVGMAVVLAAFAMGGDGVVTLPLGWVIVASLIGCFLIGLVITIVGDIGVEHGLSFPVYMRAPFGTSGTHIPSIVRAITASIWFGINTYFGSTAMNGILNILTGFDNWVLCFAIFATVQIINTAIGIKAIERFADVAAPIIILISIWIYYVLSGQAASNGTNVWSIEAVEAPATTGVEVFNGFMLVILAVLGFWSTLGNDIPSISRFIKGPKHERNWFKRNKGTIVGTLITMPIVQTFMVAIGGVSYIALGNYDPVVALQESASGLVLAILLLMIILAQWSTNTAANVVPAATIFSNVGGPKVPFYVGVVIAGIVGTLAQPWALFSVLSPFLLYSGAILSGVIGILIVDYYIIRKRRVNVPDLYRSEGQYRYNNGVNLAGYISWILGGGLALIFVNYSFFVGFFVSAIAYYFLAKHWYFRKFKQAEVEDPDDEKYLALTVGKDWVIDEKDDSEKDNIASV